MATTRSTLATRFTNSEGGADQAEEASYITERHRNAQIEAQRSKTVHWTVRLTNASLLQPDEPMTLCGLFGYLEETHSIDPATDLETAAYFDEYNETVMVVRPRGGTCDEALREAVLKHQEALRKEVLARK